METSAKLYSLNYSNVRTYLFALLFVTGNIALPQICHLVPYGGPTFLKRLCQEHQKEMPTQIKLVYDVISNRINADYSYDIIFSDDQNKTAYDVLDEWYQLEKSNEK